MLNDCFDVQNCCEIHHSNGCISIIIHTSQQCCITFEVFSHRTQVYMYEVTGYYTQTNGYDYINDDELLLL